MVAGWASSIGSPGRAQDFLESDPIMIFGKKAIEALDPGYNAAQDFTQTLDAACNFHLQKEYGTNKTKFLGAWELLGFVLPF